MIDNEFKSPSRLVYEPLISKYLDVKSRIKDTIKQLKKYLSSVKYHSKLKQFTNKMALLDVPITPEMLGVLEWPYIHNEWDVLTRLDKIIQHYEIIARKYPILIGLNESSSIEILNLNAISEGISIVIDHPSWFIREGELVINIFRNDLRVASIAFSIAYEGNDIVAYVGALQGIHGGVGSEESLEIYKKLTKDFYGLRPKSLVLKVFKLIAKKMGVKRVLCVADEHRHHRHPYFDSTKATELKGDYNLIWEEHSGQLIDQIGFYEIPLKLLIKDFTLIQSKKRGQYRRRYDFLDSVEKTINSSTIFTNNEIQ